MCQAVLVRGIDEPGATDAVDAAMRRALGLARAAGRAGEVPVGAVVLSGGGGVLAEAANARQAQCDPTAHAEIRALRAAGAALGDSHLEGCTLVVTLEPCTMCAGAIVLARVSRLVFAAWEPRTGACGSVRDVVRDSRANHQVEVHAGLRAEESQALLTDFFAQRR
ncbi:tRNA-specific adenosine deaminase [Actinomyces capricornis]|uniref:tRNA-specific adenosine deaminase n=2 Tax=Actinomyces capricornis TaxID=2755559 RepID=A0ABM7UAI4_9ACTO|nr:tRNA-specific adenosine deaminase [Actinomyces capricornis]